MNKPLIILKNISKRFEKNNIKVLKDINFTFKKGKTYSIMGPSGSGKSTFLNILSLIDRPTSGSLFFDSSKIDFNNIEKNDHLRASKIGIIYQENNLLSDFNALENVYLTKLTINNDLITAKKDANKILNKMNLKNRQNHYPSELSGGEAQRVAISRAVINSPEIILADEPSGSLDHKNSKEIFKLLFKLKNKNRVLIYATHNLYFAKMADYKLQIHDGKIKTYNARIWKYKKIYTF